MPENAASFLTPDQIAALRKVLKAFQELIKSKSDSGKRAWDLRKEAGYISTEHGLFVYGRKNELDGEFARRFLRALATNRNEIEAMPAPIPRADIGELAVLSPQFPPTGAPVVSERRRAQRVSAVVPFGDIHAVYLQALQKFVISHPVEQMFRGYKVLLRVAFENTGRIAREVIKFETKNNVISYTWWFQTAGGVGEDFRRENEGVVVMADHCYSLIGFHNTKEGNDLRIRSAFLEKDSFIPTIGAQIGVATSTNARFNYPASTRFVWITTSDDDISQETETRFLNRVVGFFGEPNGLGLPSLTASFDASMEKDIISDIWLYINNNTPDEKLMAAQRDKKWIEDVQPILNEKADYIISHFTDASTK
jgi:hypothetical protein